jgi:hypothetical protein
MDSSFLPIGTLIRVYEYLSVVSVSPLGGVRGSGKVTETQQAQYEYKIVPGDKATKSSRNCRS